MKLELGQLARELKHKQELTFEAIANKSELHLLTIQNTMSVGAKRKDYRISSLIKLFKAFGYNVTLTPINSIPPQGSFIIHSQDNVQRIESDSPTD